MVTNSRGNKKKSFEAVPTNDTLLCYDATGDLFSLYYPGCCFVLWQVNWEFLTVTNRKMGNLSHLHFSTSSVRVVSQSLCFLKGET